MSDRSTRGGLLIRLGNIAETGLMLVAACVVAALLLYLRDWAGKQLTRTLPGWAAFLASAIFSFLLRPTP